MRLSNSSVTPRRKTGFLYFAGIFLLMTLTACPTSQNNDPPPSNSSDVGSVSMWITWPEDTQARLARTLYLTPAGVIQIKTMITGDQIDSPMSWNFDAAAGEGVMNDIPAGTYNVNVEGLNSVNETTYVGCAFEIIVTAGQETLVEITMHQVPSSIVWEDGFESYIAGEFPSENWTYSGNSSIVVDDSFLKEGEKSLKMPGTIGGSWEAMAFRLMDVTTNEDVAFEFYIYISSDHQQGVHPFRGMVYMSSINDWTKMEWAAFNIDFSYDDNIYGRKSIDPMSSQLLGTDGVLRSYTIDTWYKVKLMYVRENATTVNQYYWIDGVFNGAQNISAHTNENDLLYFGFSSGDGTIWIDDIRVYSLLPKYGQIKVIW